MVPRLAARTPASLQPPAGGASASQIRIPSVTKITVKYPDGTEVKLSSEEQVAFVFLKSIEFLEYSCSNPTYLGRVCSLDELIEGIRGKNGTMLGLSQNPSQDPNYRYTLTISDTGDHYQIEAIPQHTGVGGFLSLGKKGFMFGDSFYNPKGRATTTSSKLGNMNIAGPDFRR